MKPIRYKSSDGLEIPGIPHAAEGRAARRTCRCSSCRTAVPGRATRSATTRWRSSSPTAATPCCTPNFRGSTGYGKKFLNAGNNEWGGKMQDDITWGVKHLVAQGIADPKRVAILGGSYGGYATLAGVAFTPDLYAAAVSIVGPSNLLTLLESIPPYWEAGRKMFHMRMGDPTTPEGKKQLERQSPLNSAAKIKTPLLVVQGANDPRVKKAESDQIVVALRDRKLPRRIHRRARRGARVRASREQHGDVRGDREVPVRSTWARATRNDAGGRLGAAEGDHRRSDDRHADEAGRPTSVTMPAPSQPLEMAPATLRRDDRARRAVDEAGVDQHRHRGGRHAHRDGNDEDPAG